MSNFEDVQNFAGRNEDDRPEFSEKVCEVLKAVEGIAPEYHEAQALLECALHCMKHVGCEHEVFAVDPDDAIKTIDAEVS